MNRDEENYLRTYRIIRLLNVPLEYRTETVCKVAVQENVLALRFVPIKLRTEEICLAAVKVDSTAWKFVPKGLRAEVERRLKEEGNE
jgi:hypothetical protein